MKPLSIAILALTIGAGCSHDPTMDGPVCASAVKASGGVRPVYEFEGGAVLSISVVRASEPDSLVWGLATPDQDGVQSPLKHGDRPLGAVETSREEPTLKKSVPYLVRVERTTGEVCTVKFIP